MGRKVVAPLRREQILNGLFLAMSKKGFEAVSITDIAKEAGVTRGILHYYFTNKDEMLVELMRSISEIYVRRLNRFISKEKTPLDKLSAFFRFHTIGEEQEVHALTGVWVEYWGKAAGGHSAGEVIANLQAKLRGLIEEIFKEGIRDGSITGVDPAAASAVILGAVEGILLQWRVNSKAINLSSVLGELEKIVKCMGCSQINADRSAKNGKNR